MLEMWYHSQMKSCFQRENKFQQLVCSHNLHPSAIHAILLNVKHSHFMHLKFWGISFLNYFCHTCCFAMSLNAFLLPSHYFFHDSTSEWFQPPLKFIGSYSAVCFSSVTMTIVARSIREFRCSLDAFSVLLVLQSFIVESLKIFQGSYFIRVQSGLRD